MAQNPGQGGRSSQAAQDAQLPIEPHFPPVTFQELQPPGNLKDRIDAILYGITIDIPPEYDRYGYEIRRHMAKIGGRDVLTNVERVNLEIQNIAKAEAALDRWNADLSAEFQTLEARIETENASPKLRKLLQYNKGKALAFMAECRSWIRNNKEMLSILSRVGKAYKGKGTDLKFQNRKDLERFAAHHKARQKSLAIIRKYDAFRVMVY